MKTLSCNGELTYPRTYQRSESSLSRTVTRQFKRSVRAFLVHRSLKFLRTYYSGLGRCLLYHRVGPQNFGENESSPYRGLTVSRKSFDEQVRHFKQNYNCLSLPHAVELLKAGALPVNSLVLTFDDGYKDNLLNALPVLEKYEVPATIYVTTGLVDRCAELWWFEQEFIIRNSSKLEFVWEGTSYHWSLKSPQDKYWAIEHLNIFFKSLTLTKQKSFMQQLRLQCDKLYSYDSEMLTWPELKEIDQHPLITIGAHTLNHPILTLMNSEEVEGELCGSRSRLESQLGHPVLHLAYPFGGPQEVGRREFEVAKKSGFSSAVTTRHGHLYREHDNYLHALPRISVNHDDTLERIAWKLSGMYSMVQHRGKRIITE